VKMTKHLGNAQAKLKKNAGREDERNSEAGPRKGCTTRGFGLWFP